MKRMTTDIIPNDSIRHKSLFKRDYTSKGTASLLRKEIAISIRGVTETLLLSSRTRLYIGRFHPTNAAEVDLDLSPYGGGEYGVSRLHACFDVNQQNNLFITDLRSTNGTMIAGKELKAYEPKLVHNGDKIVLGNLLMTVNFSPISND